MLAYTTLTFPLKAWSTCSVGIDSTLDSIGADNGLDSGGHVRNGRSDVWGGGLGCCSWAFFCRFFDVSGRWQKQIQESFINGKSSWITQTVPLVLSWQNGCLMGMLDARHGGDNTNTNSQTCGCGQFSSHLCLQVLPW